MIEMKAPQFPPSLTMISHRLSHELPKSPRVIHLAHVTQLVDDNIINELFGKKKNFVIETQSP